RVQRLEEDRDDDRPAMTGSAPASPERTRATQALTYSPKVWAMSSGATAMAAASFVGSVSSSTAETCGSSVVGTAAPTRSVGESRRRSRRHDVDDGRYVELGRGTDRGHAAEEHDGDPIRDLEDVVHVVRH